MKSIDFKASTLIIDMGYDCTGPSGNFINFKRLHLLAANKYGEPMGEKLLHTVPCNTFFAEVVEPENVPAAILAFLDGNFEHGQPQKLVARSMHDSLRYFEQSAPLVANRLKGAMRFDVDTLIQMDPLRSLVSADRRRASRNANNTFAEFLFFQAIYEAKQAVPTH